MTKTITWLHLSDLHLCKPKNRYDADLLLDTLCADLERLRDRERLSPDFIFFTGDAAYGHLGDKPGYRIEEQFEEVWCFLEQIRELYATVPTENVFLVPGNHDVNRNHVHKTVTAWLAGLHNAPNAVDEVTAMLRDKDATWGHCMERLSDYHDFLELLYPHLLQDRDRLIYGELREVNGINVGIGGLNTAWSCSGDDRGKLWFGGHWQIQTVRQKLKEAEVRIGLAHHPTSWLNAFEAPALDQEIERTFDFFLHGHEHNDWVVHHNDHIRIAGGAAYNRSDKENGYNLVRMDVETNTCEVWLRDFDNKGGGWRPTVISGKNDEDKIGVWQVPSAFKRFVRSTPNESTVEDKPASTLVAQETEATTTQTARTVSVDAAPEPAKVEGPESRGVFGRGPLLEKLSKLLAEPKILVVYGLPGMGKTEVIKEIQHLPDYEEHGKNYIRIYARPQTGLHDIYQPIASELGVRGQAPEIPRNDWDEYDFVQMKDFPKATQPMLVHILNAQLLFEGGLDRDLRDFFVALCRHLPNVKLILESRTKVPESTFVNAVRITGLNPADVQQYFGTTPLPDKDMRWSLSLDEAKVIFNRVGGKNKPNRAHPLSLFLLAMVSEGRNLSPLDVLSEHENLLWNELQTELFDELYKLLNPNEQRMLRFCALYRVPIPHQHEDMLDAYVGEAEMAEVETGEDGIFRGLVNRCILSAADQGLTYVLHQVLAELAQRATLMKDHERGESHEQIAETWLKYIGRQRTRPHLLWAGEAAYHFAESGRWDRLDQISLEFLRQGHLLSILEDWSRELNQRGDTQTNQRVLELIVYLDQGNAKAHNFLGVCIEALTFRGNPEALDHYKTACTLAPDHPMALANLGRCYLARNEPQAFLDYHKRLSSYNRERVMQNDVVVSIYTNALQRVGRASDASQIRQKAIERRAKHPAFYADEARYLSELADYTSALMILSQAVEMGIENDYLRSIRGTVLQKSGRNNEASQIRRQAIADGTTTHVFYADEAIALNDAGRYADALAILDQADARGIADDRLIMVRSTVLAAKGDHHAAAQLRLAQIEAGSRNVAFYAEQAVYYRNRGDFAKAHEMIALVKKLGIADEATGNIYKSIVQREQDAQWSVVEKQTPRVSLTSLSGKQVEALQQAMLAAYDESRLKQMVRIELDERLDQIARGDTFSEVVFNLIEWAESMGKVDALVQGAVARNPDSPELKRFVAEARSGG
ncbi:MAG: effector-associated domain EAD1-containing protein [Chloroflexota bacterium]